MALMISLPPSLCLSLRLPISPLKGFALDSQSQDRYTSRSDTCMYILKVNMLTHVERIPKYKYASLIIQSHIVVLPHKHHLDCFLISRRSICEPVAESADISSMEGISGQDFLGCVPIGCFSLFTWDEDSSSRAFSFQKKSWKRVETKH